MNRVRDIWHWCQAHPLLSLLGLAFLGRLYGITFPPLEVGHQWRQSTVLMVARNFAETGADLMHPRVDMAGELSGITGMEFPLLNYLIYLMAQVFDPAHWYGRLLVLLIGSVGIWRAATLVERYTTRQVAQTFGVLLVGSLWFSFSRKVMPDIFSLALVMMGLERLDHHLNRQGRSVQGLVGLMLIGLGIASKLPAATLALFALVIANTAMQRGQLSRLWPMAVMGVLPLGFVGFWYGVWVPHLVAEYGYWHFFMGDSLSVGWHELFDDIPKVLKRYYQSAMGYIGFTAYLLGLYWLIREGSRAVQMVFLLLSIGFGLVMVKAGWAFAHHNYYILPFVPVMCWIAAEGLSRYVPSRLLPFLLALIVGEGVLNQIQDFRIKDEVRFLADIEEELDTHLGRDALLFVNSGDNPAPLYFSHRKGWVGWNTDIAQAVYRDSLQQLGLDYVLILNKSYEGAVQLPDLEAIRSGEDWVLFELGE